ncbi:GNAT family N-acetyltransferase [Arthrobacter sp. AG258]|uniref:GNAT family N-acetyltransferase n=1 Tax=Arthrobacter sp. AG258 TaxID=2183899 RepID=UPI001060DC41|nr:GNAT family N-acetyltransferase [Arthrobacter sp. AG258]
MQNLEIRRATWRDASSLAALFDAYRVFYGQCSNAKAAKAFIESRLKHDESVIFLATCGAGVAPVGFTQLYPTFSSISMSRRLILNDLFVQPTARGRGIGRLLITAARDFAVATEVHGMQLETAVGNVGARALYESEGWKLQQAFCSYELMT